MNLIRAIVTALVGWRVARFERERMRRIEHELEIRRELDYLDARLGKEGTTKVLTSNGITQAVSDEFFRHRSS